MTLGHFFIKNNLRQIIVFDLKKHDFSENRFVKLYWVGLYHHAVCIITTNLPYDYGRAVQLILYIDTSHVSKQCT